MAAEFWINDGTAPRKAAELYFNDGVAVRTITEAWFNDGTAVRQVYSAGAITSFTALNALAQSADGTGTKTATATFSANGTVSQSGSPTETNGGAPLQNWFTPTTGGIGSSYWLRVTATSGTFTSETSGWHSLSSGSVYTKGGTGSGSVTFTVEISSDASGTPVVLTVAGNTLAFNSTPA